MITKRTSNGNWLAKAEPDDLNGREDLLIYLLWAMEDCGQYGDQYCISNYDMAVDMYDYYTGKTVRIIYSDVDKLREGGWVTFYARETEFVVGDEVEIFDEPGEVCGLLEILGDECVVQYDDGRTTQTQMKYLVPHLY